MLGGLFARKRHGGGVPRSASVGLLIDVDNASAAEMAAAHEAAGALGQIVFARAYGREAILCDREKAEALEATGIELETCESLGATGRNAADIALAADAGLLLGGRPCEWLVIASNDGDYTPLVAKAHGRGTRVLGVGRTEAPELFVEACDAFVVVPRKATPREGQAPAPVTPPGPCPLPRPNAQLRKKELAALQDALTKPTRDLTRGTTWKSSGACPGAAAACSALGMSKPTGKPADWLLCGDGFSVSAVRAHLSRGGMVCRAKDMVDLANGKEPRQEADGAPSI